MLLTAAAVIVTDPLAAKLAVIFCVIATGAILSTTVTICVAVAVRPEPSVTVQVTVVLPNGYVVGASFVVDATEQLSPVVGVPKVTVEAAATHVPVPTLTLTADGAEIVGTILSTIVTITNTELAFSYRALNVS